MWSRVDQLPEKLTGARTLGAHEAYTPQEAIDAGVKAAVVVEAAGHPAALETAIALTAAGGRTITVGLPRPDARISVSPLGFVAEGRSLIGSYLGSAVPDRDIPQFVELWRSGRLPVESLVSSRITLDDINTAMDNLADGIAVRQLISFDTRRACKPLSRSACRVLSSHSASRPVERSPQRATLQGEQLLGNLPVGQQRVEPVTGAGEHVQLGGDPGPQQPQRIVECLVAQRIDVRAGDECRWQVT